MMVGTCEYIYRREYDAGKRRTMTEGIEAVMAHNNLVERQQEVWVKVNYNSFIAHSYHVSKR